MLKISAARCFVCLFFFNSYLTDVFSSCNNLHWSRPFLITGLGLSMSLKEWLKNARNVYNVCASVRTTITFT
jgi:hypothetical protein